MLKMLVVHSKNADAPGRNTSHCHMGFCALGRQITFRAFSSDSFLAKYLKMGIGSTTLKRKASCGCIPSASVERIPA